MPDQLPFGPPALNNGSTFIGADATYYYYQSPDGSVGVYYHNDPLVEIINGPIEIAAGFSPISVIEPGLLPPFVPGPPPSVPLAPVNTTPAPPLIPSQPPSAESQITADEAAAGVVSSPAADAFSVYGTNLNIAEAAATAVLNELTTNPANLGVDATVVNSATPPLLDLQAALHSTYDNTVAVVTNPDQQYNFFSTMIAEVQAATDSILKVAGIALANSKDVFNSVIEELVAPAATKFISSTLGIALQVEIGVASDPNVGVGLQAINNIHNNPSQTINQGTNRQLQILEQQAQQQNQAKFQVSPRSGPLSGSSLEVINPSKAVPLNNFMSYIDAIERQEQGDSVYVGVQAIQQADASLLGNATVLQPTLQRIIGLSSPAFSFLQNEPNGSAVATDINALTNLYLGGSPAALAAAKAQTQTDIATGLKAVLGSVANIDPNLPNLAANALLGDFDLHVGLVANGKALDAAYDANAASGMDAGEAVRSAIYASLHFPT